MGDIDCSTPVDLLEYLHGRLDAHFTNLRESRRSGEVESGAPVFALEHGLSDEDRDLLLRSVRAAVAGGLSEMHRRSWLPFVVYAAESGYDYEGNEYWRSFETDTPGWRIEHRHTLKRWFKKFAAEYSGAEPTGAFASNFTIIAWPITHAVLPIYLQRQLAQLLYEFSGALTSELMNDTAALGLRLVARASDYSDRFRVFCENTTLLGQVAAALLSGNDETTPLLLTSTLERIIEDLSKEQQARHWLRSARQSAHRARGFLPTGASRQISGTQTRLTRTTDPKLFLRLEDHWNAYAELPDMTSLGTGMPDVYGQLRVSRGEVSGGERPIAPSALLYPGQTVRFASWPCPNEPFLRLLRVGEATNRILADHCAISPGPWWLFRRQGPGLAVEVRSMLVRPAHRYLLVGAESIVAPAVSWCEEVAFDTAGARVYELDVPAQVSEVEAAILRSSGVTVVANFAIRPVGVVASAWDGEGVAEWLAGEPAIVGIRSDLAPQRCRLTISGDAYFLDWKPGEVELMFSLDGLAVGTHGVGVSLLGVDDRRLTSGFLAVTIRDPQIRPQGASIGEGIRLLASPARPTLSELWDERADITIDGPIGSEAGIEVSLRDENGSPIADLTRSIRLPLGKQGWTELAKKMRKDPRFSAVYDEAESCVVSVSREGVGFATLTCERGFQPLRWTFAKMRDGHVIARLIDRTDGGNTRVEFYDVESPVISVPKSADAEIDAPPRGGLVIAHSRDSTASVVLPTDANRLLRSDSRRAQPSVTTAGRSPNGVFRLVKAHARWLTAELPADAFAEYEQQLVGDAIARAIGNCIGGTHWARIERRLESAQDAADYLEEMQRAVGITTSHKELATTVACNLYKWLSPGELLPGFSEVIAPYLAPVGLDQRPAVARFLLTLAHRPGYLAEWDDCDVIVLLEHVLQTPVLYRAARFAILGTRFLNADGLERSFS